MTYKVESSLWDFPAWSGGKDTLDTLIEKGDCDAVEEFIEECFGDDLPTDTEINDILWFERDAIAEHLGYRDWDAYEDGWSESDLSDAEDWWCDREIEEKVEVSKAKDEDAAEDWWDGLSDAKKVEVYYEND